MNQNPYFQLNCAQNNNFHVAQIYNRSRTINIEQRATSLLIFASLLIHNTHVTFITSLSCVGKYIQICCSTVGQEISTKCVSVLAFKLCRRALCSIVRLFNAHLSFKIQYRKISEVFKLILIKKLMFCRFHGKTFYQPCSNVIEIICCIQYLHLKQTSR